MKTQLLWSTVDTQTPIQTFELNCLLLHVPTLSPLPCRHSGAPPLPPPTFLILSPPHPAPPHPTHFTMSRRLSDGCSCRALRRLFALQLRGLAKILPSIPPSPPPSIHPSLSLTLPPASTPTRPPPSNRPKKDSPDHLERQASRASLLLVQLKVNPLRIWFVSEKRGGRDAE